MSHWFASSSFGTGRKRPSRTQGERSRRAGKMPDARVSPRERLVLTAIIELYIASGEPVASQAVARFFANREGLSSATLRNVMAGKMPDARVSPRDRLVLTAIIELYIASGEPVAMYN